MELKSLSPNCRLNSFIHVFNFLKMEKKVESWGHDSHGEEVFLIRLTNGNGDLVVLSNYGARVVSIVVPDSLGICHDVVLGYYNLSDYIAGHEYFGSTVGRYANRIAHAKFSLEGVTYSVDKNCDANHIHGGSTGFSHRTWRLVETAEPNAVAFQLFSPNGEGGFPGNLSTTVIYKWSESATLSISFLVTTDVKTVLNLTHHSYFNLAGEGNGTIENQILQLNASHYLETDAALIPTGRLMPVENTHMDFRRSTSLKPGLESNAKEIVLGGGYDHCWVVDNYKGNLVEIATLMDETSGRVMKVSSTLPGMQVYTTNMLNDTIPGRAGRPYGFREAVCIEPQFFPDTPNHSDFPSCVVMPDQPFVHIIEYSFSCLKQEVEG